MQAFLETDRAIALARDMAAEMLRTDSFSFPPSEQYKLSSLNKSTMFGIMVCNDINGNEKILRAFSGALNGKYRIPGYVNPCFSVTEFRKIEAEYSPLIHRADEDERKRLSAECLGKINALYSFSTWDGRLIGLPDKAPTGTGDCAGLRLINTALRKNLEIRGLAEFMIGDDGTIETYPPCKERCSLLLPSMLGLDILYADESIAIINKEAGMLSVPGRGEDKLDSASYRFHKLFPSSPKECFVHRLDMDTSGLLVMAFTKDAHRKLSMAFEARDVEKEYEALLEGVIKEEGGIIDSPMRLDVEHRPLQIIDPVQGKRAITVWKRLGVTIVNGRKFTRVRFYPKTGRTHQLRVHSASIGHPIAGDRLYGERKEGERLMLHAARITFRHPVTGESVSFSSDPPF